MTGDPHDLTALHNHTAHTPEQLLHWPRHHSYSMAFYTTAHPKTPPTTLFSPPSSQHGTLHSHTSHYTVLATTLTAWHPTQPHTPEHLPLHCPRHHPHSIAPYTATHPRTPPITLSSPPPSQHGTPPLTVTYTSTYQHLTNLLGGSQYPGLAFKVIKHTRKLPPQVRSTPQDHIHLFVCCQHFWSLEAVVWRGCGMSKVTTWKVTISLLRMC